MAKRKPSNKPIQVFLSYAHEDEKMRDEIAKRLKVLEADHVIASWHDRAIKPGANWKTQIDENLKLARVILLLISPDFLASDYCHGKEARIALKRHKAREACVIPIILRPCDEWKNTKLGNLQALPRDGKPITLWRPQDLGYQNIGKGIREAISDLKIGVTPTFTPNQGSQAGILPKSNKRQNHRRHTHTKHEENAFRAYPFEWIDRRRKEALSKTWTGIVTPLIKLPHAPKRIPVVFKFKSGWKIVTGSYSFKSFKPGTRGKIINHFQGGFYDDHVLKIDYIHADRRRFGFGVLLLSLSGDSFTMDGFVTGLSSNYDQLFASKITLDAAMV